MKEIIIRLEVSYKKLATQSVTEVLTDFINKGLVHPGLIFNAFTNIRDSLQNAEQVKRTEFLVGRLVCIGLEKQKRIECNRDFELRCISRKNDSRLDL